MGKYNSVTLDRDRAFDVNSLQELLTQGKSILNEYVGTFPAPWGARKL